MPQLATTERKVRAGRLRAIGARAHRRLLESKLGGVHEVLMESGDVGRTKDFARVRVLGGARAGTFVDVRTEAIDETDLVGRARAPRALPAGAS